MRKKFLLLTILVVLFVIFVVSRFFILSKQNVYGRLKVLSSPAASVFLNNLVIGKTPFEDKVKLGEKILKLIPEGTATDTASWQGKIKISRNALTFVNVELGSSEVNTAGEVFTIEKMETPAKNKDTGEVFVETDPLGAIVNLDNDEKGVASLLLTEVPKGEHEISVFLPGFFRRTQKINVTPNYRINSHFKLAVDQSKQRELKEAKNLEEGGGSTESAAVNKIVVIKETPTGWLRVRGDASLTASEEAKVKPGEKYRFLEEKSGWYKIKYDDKEGWVSSRYAKLTDGTAD